jgi:hypothetical protein
MNEDNLWDSNREKRKKPLYGYSKNPITPYLSLIAQFPHVKKGNPTPIQTVKTGNLNKVCPNCGHKNKKCTCKK